jgi:Flp pilus assembly protein TadD
LAAASSFVTFLAQREGGAVTGLNLLPLSTRIANAAVAYIRYLGKLVWPTDMAIFYPYHEDLAGWLVIASLVALLVLTVAAYRARRTRPYFTLGWFWFFGTLVPVIGIVQVGTQAIADRYTYVPYIGLFVAIAWGSAELLSRMRVPAIAGAAAATVIVGGLSAITAAQVQVWQSNASLWRHAMAVTTGNYLALNEVGMTLAAENRHPEALEYFQQSSQNKPEYAEVRNNLGLTYVQLGRLPEALAQYEMALRLKPAFPEAERNYAHALMIVGRSAEAETHFRRAIALKPDFPEAYNNLGILLASESRVDEAIQALQNAVRLSHSSTESQFLLGMAYGAANRLDDAEAAFRAVLRNDANHVAAKDGLARIEKMRRGK